MQIEFDVEEIINDAVKKEFINKITQQIAYEIRQELYGQMQDAFAEFYEKLENKISIALETDAKLKIRKHLSNEMKKIALHEAGRIIAEKVFIRGLEPVDFKQIEKGYFDQKRRDR